MNGSRCCRSVTSWCCALYLLAPSLAVATETQAELTCLLGSAEPLATERLVSARSGRENRARFTLLRHEPGWLPGIDTSAALRLELALDDLGSDLGQALLRDGGSFVGIDWRGMAAWRFGLRVLPFDTDYERLGYLHALDWGGTDVGRGESIFVAQQGGVPGLELGLQGARAELWAGLRWATVPDGLAAERRLWAALLRGRLSPARTLRADFGLGYFQRPALGFGSNELPSFVEGASLRLVWQRGLAEPALATEPFRAPSFREAAAGLTAAQTRGAAVALEGVVLVTALRRFEAPAQTTLSAAPAAALYGSARGDVLEGHAALAWRSLPFVQRNQPGLARGETLPSSTQPRAELSAWVGASATSARLHLTPSLELGVLVPAALEAPSVLPGYGQTFVVRETGEVLVLPIGSARLPIAAGRAALRVQLSSTTALAGFVDYERDPNRVRFETSALGARRAFASPDRLGLGAALQARF